MVGECGAGDAVGGAGGSGEDVGEVAGVAHPVDGARGEAEEVGYLPDRVVRRSAHRVGGHDIFSARVVLFPVQVCDLRFCAPAEIFSRATFSAPAIISAGGTATIELWRVSVLSWEKKSRLEQSVLLFSECASRGALSVNSSVELFLLPTVIPACDGSVPERALVGCRR